MNPTPTTTDWHRHGKLLCSTDPARRLDYFPSWDTDVRRTFARARAEQTAAPREASAAAARKRPEVTAP